MQVERWAARQGRRKPDGSSWRPLAGVASMALLSSTNLLLGACDSTSEPQTTIRSDSAGIAITTALAPQWGSGEGWTISKEPLLEIGAVDGPGEYLLDGVIGAVPSLPMAIIHGGR